MNKRNFARNTFISLSLFTAVLCVGCTTDKVDDSRGVEENTTVKRCWDTGGMPVRSIWDDRFLDCIYPPNN